jgi:hypothetical protein
MHIENAYMTATYLPVYYVLSSPALTCALGYDSGASSCQEKLKIAPHSSPPPGAPLGCVTYRDGISSTSVRLLGVGNPIHTGTIAHRASQTVSEEQWDQLKPIL